MFYCPSRRPAGLYGFPDAVFSAGQGGNNWYPTYAPYTVAKSDYAANGGTMGFLPGPTNGNNTPNDYSGGPWPVASIADAAKQMPFASSTWYFDAVRAA